MNVDMREVLIFYNIITVVCILIISFATVYMRGNISTSPLIRLQLNLPTCSLLGEVNTINIFILLFKNIASVQLKLNLEI